MAEYGSPGSSNPSMPGLAGETENREFQSTREVLKASRDQAMDEARVAIRNMAEDQKSKAAEGLGSVAHALHETARTLTAENQAFTARYTDMAAEQLERASRLLRDKKWDDLVVEAERFARSQPTLFIGGAIATGFFLARFLKSVPASGAEFQGRGMGEETASGASIGGPYGHGIGATTTYSGSGTMSGET